MLEEGSVDFDINKYERIRGFLRGSIKILFFGCRDECLGNFVLKRWVVVSYRFFRV